jgi:hypothetical protein
MLTIEPPPPSDITRPIAWPTRTRLQVDVEDGGPVGLGDVEEVGRLEDAGVVDERIDAAQSVAGGGEGRVDVALSADVAVAIDDVCAIGFQLPCEAVTEAVVDIPDRDRGTVARKPLRAGRTDPLGTSGDHGDTVSRGGSAPLASADLLGARVGWDRARMRF